MLGSSGLIHMQGRVMDASIGRFLSPDPYITEPCNTQNFNRYSYVLNNPLSYIDPTGFDYITCTNYAINPHCDDMEEVLVGGCRYGGRYPNCNSPYSCAYGGIYPDCRAAPSPDGPSTGGGSGAGGQTASAQPQGEICKYMGSRCYRPAPPTVCKRQSQLHRCWPESGPS